MKAVILAGGIGSRLSEETTLRPKPMVEVGGKPILWHIMKIYSAYGIQDFVICLGYKGYAIKEYFANYVLHMSDVTIDLEHNSVEWHDSRAENWRVTLVDTGEETMTGGRIKRIRSHVDGESFLLTSTAASASPTSAGSPTSSLATSIQRCSRPSRTTPTCRLSPPALSRPTAPSSWAVLA